MISIWISFSITQHSVSPCPSQRILPKMTPVSVEDTYTPIRYARVTNKIHKEKKSTLMVALMLWNPCGAMVYTAGRSTSLRSPSVAKSKQRFWRVLGVWLTNKTSTCDVQEHEQYTRTRKSYPVRYQTRAFWRMPRRIWDPRILRRT